MSSMMKPTHIILFLTIPVLLASLLSRLSPFTFKVKDLKAQTLSVNLRAQEDIQPSAFGSYYIGGYQSGVLYEITWNPQLRVIDTLKPVLSLNSILGIAVVDVFAVDEDVYGVAETEILGERLLLCDPTQGLVEAVIYRRHVQGEYRFMNATHRTLLNEANGQPIVLCDAVRSKADLLGNIHVILTDASRMDIKYIHQELFAYPSGRLLYLNLTQVQEREKLDDYNTDVVSIANSLVRIVREKAAYPIGVEIVDVINERVKFICVEAFGPYITEYNYEIPTGETLARSLVKNGIIGNNVTPMKLRLPHHSELVRNRKEELARPSFDAMYLIAVPHVYSGPMKFISWMVSPLRFLLAPFLPFPVDFNLSNFPLSPPGGLAILNRNSGDLVNIYVSGENEEDLRGTSSALIVDAPSDGRSISVLLGSPLESNPLRLATIDFEETAASGGASK